MTELEAHATPEQIDAMSRADMEARCAEIESHGHTIRANELRTGWSFQHGGWEWEEDQYQ